MKQILIAVYFFSAVYCYMGTNALIDRAVYELLKRHPNIPPQSMSGWKGFKAHLEMLALSLIPVVNLVVGYFFNNVSDEMIAEIVSSVEIEHWHEIKDFERFTEELDGSDPHTKE